MKNWEKFELDCTQYLKNKFRDYAQFVLRGGSDSTHPDIFVPSKNFFIEAKHSPAQCGQFVLIPNIINQTFEYSSRNITPLNVYSQAIINHMNNYFETFLNAGTAGIDINMKDGESIFYGWIMEHYADKNTRFFITNNYVIFPIERFSEYFAVNAKYRIKKSGSAHVGKKYAEELSKYISLNPYYKITQTRIDNNRLFAVALNDLSKQHFTYYGNEYMFSLTGNEYELRKLSNTFNSNVIFDIKLKNTVGISDEEFIRAL